MPAEIEQIVVRHCSPVLMGRKPAALFMLRAGDCFTCLSALLPQNIALFVLRKTNSRFLVLLYEKTMLEKTLQSDAVSCFLSALGYPAVFPVSYPLRYLKRQFQYQDFPHEVGLFLGYPVEDVRGFVEHKGRDYKFCGYWKVYGNVEQAKTRFRQFDLCQECIKTVLRNNRVMRQGLGE